MVGFRQSLLAAAFAHAVHASVHSSPLIAWSSLSRPTPAQSTADAVFEHWMHSGEVCDFDAVILVNQQGLHTSDLRTLTPSSPLFQLINSAASTIQVPSAQLSVEQSRETVTNDLSRRCGSRLLYSVSEAHGLHKEDIYGNKFIVNLNAPAMGLSGNRRQQMDVVVTLTGSQLAGEIEGLSSAFPKHLVIYSDWQPTHSVLTRQEAPVAPSKKVVGGILKHYQLLSPGLIISLFLSIFVLIPVVLVGIQALSSIKSPVRLDGKMLAEYRQKKNQ
ncbi:hypothetical protein BXZ70DRAFT_433961 [Cristinia sonorae]|uniref:Protein BIG1 n=1 Tax=Cristinia sonorae TaxID=1940300 RepID=A0A8K0UXQ7_9AGAR|nr:hypothetical protein BXZ70DRAFT_433961 [Cristinia sonorae]